MESVNKKMFKITPPSQTGGGGGGRGGKYSGNGQHHHAGGQMQPRDGAIMAVGPFSYWTLCIN